MKSTDINVIAYPAWENGGSVWYSVCMVTLYNCTDEDILNPAIAFSVDSSQSLSSYTNFSFTQSGTTVTGFLTEHNVVPAGGSVSFEIGVSNNSGVSIGNLPFDFTVNGEDADPPADDQPPSVPTGLNATSVGAQTISLSWEPATDNVMVAGYQVQYSANGIPPAIIQVSGTSVILSALVPETAWSIYVCAYDLNNNMSAWSEPLQVTTTSALPDPGPCTISAAPYIDYTAWPTPQCSKYGSESGLKNYILGFIVTGTVDGEPRPCWGGQSALSDSNDPNSEAVYSGDATISEYGKSDIAALRAAGGDIVVSFGGASGQLIEETITDIPALVSLYSGVIENYALTMIDFDIEGAALQRKDILQRHLSVISQVQALYPQLKISWTLPVDGQTDPASQGFSSYGRDFLSMIAEAGFSPSMINGMTMDFGATNPPPDVYTGCVYALNAMQAQIAAYFPKWTAAQIWRRMGATPMFGINDNATDFTPENQQQLLAFARENNLGCLSGWDATRDYNQGLAMCHTSTHNNVYACTYEGDDSYIYSKIIVEYQHN
ncbi:MULTISPECIES: fibronectin type III domain-containing protein [Enterobacterales]|uniref:fibronectin type III domain-containing protein n=1 Tax=Enterobacterales TaxID=91347 RepID=UPI002EDA46A5